MATEITIIRHGETIWNVQQRIQGQRNSKLSENGILQAELVANALAKREFDILISSDLERAVETAKSSTNNCSYLLNIMPICANALLARWKE